MNPNNPTTTSSAGAEQAEANPEIQEEETYTRKLTTAREELADLNTEYTAQLTRYRAIPPSVKKNSLAPSITQCQIAFENSSSSEDPVGRMMSNARDVLDRMVEEWRVSDMYGTIASSDDLTKDERSKIWEECVKIETELLALEKFSLRLFPVQKGKRRAADASEESRPERRRR
ncbi:hypothetical protein LTR97_008595 [Elasticomyces elasticus]|uniref:Uncharacterized protein n=1 Tax=Elasticomyces elasticus TaxID=574655 RepID=A0AAN7W3Z0_9PEZI|nr:hypothetical protein LTR97_008595 [Elasticomyces elasticus]